MGSPGLGIYPSLVLVTIDVVLNMKGLDITKTGFPMGHQGFPATYNMGHYIVVLFINTQEGHYNLDQLL